MRGVGEWEGGGEEGTFQSACSGDFDSKSRCLALRHGLVMFPPNNSYPSLNPSKLRLIIKV